jgi:hypothetical protein
MCTGLIVIAITDVNNVPVFAPQDTALLATIGSVNNTTGVAYMDTAKNTLVNPAGVTEDKGNLVFRLLDLITLGYLSQIITFLSGIMYGFITLLQNLFGPFMNPTLFGYLFTSLGGDGILRNLLTVAYVMAGWELITNKTITD